MEALQKEITLYIKSRYPIIYLVTSEENRAEKLIQDAAATTRKPCFFWSATQGYAGTEKFGKDKTPCGALDAVLSWADPGLFVLKDFYAFIIVSRAIFRTSRPGFPVNNGDAAYGANPGFPFMIKGDLSNRVACQL